VCAQAQPIKTSKSAPLATCGRQTAPLPNLRVSELFLVGRPTFRPDQLVKACSGNRNVKELLAASVGGHTLRLHDLRMILAWLSDVVSDGEHNADVMKKMDGSGKAGGGPRLKLTVAILL